MPDIFRGTEKKEEEPDPAWFFWPHMFRETPSLNDVASAGLTLLGLLVFDARKMVLNLGKYALEVEPLLHTSPQIYTRRQWEGVMRVPKAARGFKIGYALEFKSHVLCWNSFDNNFRLRWSSLEDCTADYQKRRVPDPVFEYGAWCTYTAKWLKDALPEYERSAMPVAEALSESGDQPFRGLGKYGTNEVLAIAGFPPWMRFYLILANPLFFCIIVHSFREFVVPRALQSSKYLYKATTLKPLLDTINTFACSNSSDDDELKSTVLDDDTQSTGNDSDNNGNVESNADVDLLLPIFQDPEIDCAFQVTAEQQLSYIQTLRVHARQRIYMTAREATLLDKYNAASKQTWIDRKQRIETAKKKPQKGCTFPFDMSNIRYTSTLPGNLGHVIAGTRWTTVLGEYMAEETADEKKLADACAFIEERVRLQAVTDGRGPISSLATRFDANMVLLFKPHAWLDDTERAELVKVLGWSTNPIEVFYTRQGYLKEARSCDDNQIDFEELSLIRKNGCWRPTLTIEKTNQQGVRWTAFIPPFIPRRIITGPDKNTNLPDFRKVPLYLVQSSNALVASTLREVKTHSKGWTVGPLDFVGHGRILSLGKTIFMALCFWHPSLTPTQMLADYRERESRGRYPEGMRKLSIKQEPLEKTWRSKTKRDKPEECEESMVRYIKRQRRQEREEELKSRKDGSQGGKKKGSKGQG
ncbi:hypothetical protein R3P38DRAFT_3281154, partial [Favolaschia claudopus]